MGKLSLLTSVFLICRMKGIIVLPTEAYCENLVVRIIFVKCLIQKCCISISVSISIISIWVHHKQPCW